MKFEMVDICFHPSRPWKIDAGIEKADDWKNFYLFFGPFLIEIFWAE